MENFFCKSKKEGKDQESIQSSTTPDPEYQWEICIQGSTISAHRNPNYLSIQLCAKSNKKVVQQKGQRITYILTRPCMIFLGFSEVKDAFLSLHAR